MNRNHQQILVQIKRGVSKTRDEEREWVRRYLGTTKTYCGQKTSDRYALASVWLRQNKDIGSEEITSMLNSLFNGKSFEEIAYAAILLGRLHHYRGNMDLSLLDSWLGKVEGWAETDSICQSNFPSKEILSRWPEWKKLINRFSVDKNVHKRRASFVLLIKSLRQSDDKRLSDLEFTNVIKLEGEKDILITKAVSWALRSLIKYHRDEVATYLKNHQSTLPRIAYRETKKKLETGRKNG